MILYDRQKMPQQASVGNFRLSEALFCDLHQQGKFAYPPSHLPMQDADDDDIAE